MTLTDDAVAFEFELTEAEFQEGNRFGVQQAQALGKPRLLRVPIVILNLATGACIGFLIAPALLGPIDIATQAVTMFACVAVFSLALAVERHTNIRISRRVQRGLMAASRLPKRLTIGPDGLTAARPGRMIRWDWPEVTDVRQGTLLIFFVFSPGDWLPLPLRVLDAPATLLARVATWRSAIA